MIYRDASQFKWETTVLRISDLSVNVEVNQYGLLSSLVISVLAKVYRMEQLHECMIF